MKMIYFVVASKNFSLKRWWSRNKWTNDWSIWLNNSMENDRYSVWLKSDCSFWGLNGML